MFTLNTTMYVQENNIQLLTSERLVKFIEKIGRHEAAKIIRERNVDGQTLLELDESDMCEWNLSNHQIEQLWNCICLIKSNPLTYRDVNQHVPVYKWLYGNQGFTETPDLDKTADSTDLAPEGNYGIDINYQTNNRKPLPVRRKSRNYFKFFQCKSVNKKYEKDCIERVNSKTLFLPTKDWDTVSNTSTYSYHTCWSVNDAVHRESEYIYGPCLQGEKDNLTIDRIKKYCKFRNPSEGHKYQPVEKSQKNYLELLDLTSEPTRSHPREKNIYEHPPSTEAEGTKKKYKFQCFLKLCCCSCFIGYP